MLTYKVLRVFFLLLFLIVSSFTCIAQSPPSHNEYVTLSLLSENKTLGKDPKIWIALQAQLKPGWKAYWRSPGVAGYGARIDWKDLKNINSLEIHWPIPHRFHTDFGMVNVYEGNFILPMSLEVTDLSKPVEGTLKVDLLVCDKSLCLPVQKMMPLHFPVDSGEKNPDQALQILNALSQVPSRQNTTPIKVEKAEISDNDVPPTIRVYLTHPQGFKSTALPELFMEIKDYFLDAPLVSLSKDQKTLVYSALVFPNENKIPSPIPNLIGKTLKLTIGLENQDKLYGFETQVPLQTQSLSVGLLLSILLIAFVGGLILNVMPCVLPVLSLKVLSVMRQGGQELKLIRRDFFATVLGILFSFLILAGVELFLKASGHALGWGVQFQEPLFVIGLVCILTLFAASLFGFFEFRLPSFMASIGGIKPGHDSLVGSFLEGSLVTILATPCTAPFVGTALAFSLSRGSAEIISIFLMMGLGLAFPFLLLALFPAFASKLPRPGAWMIRVKVGLGLLLILTILWLLFVLSGQLGMNSTILVATLMSLILILLSNTHSKSEVTKRITWALVGLLVITSLSLSALSHTLQTKPKASKNTLWQPFQPEKIPEYVKANKIVFVNVTADWCLTCQANKFFTLNTPEVIEELRKPDVIAMEADWTNHSVEITSYLESFNQYGIPFYAVYGCQNRTGTFLGQIITPQKVIKAIQAERCQGPLRK